MYYITNQTGEIIAADIDLLQLVNAKEISDLYKRVALGEVDFQLLSETELILHTNGERSAYPIEQATLSSILGEITIIHVLPETHAEDLITPATPTEDELFSLAEEKEEANLPETAEDLLMTDEEEPLDLGNLFKEAEVDLVQEKSIYKEEDVFKEPLPTEESSEMVDLNPEGEIKNITHETEDELFELLLPEEAEERIEGITETSITQTEESKEEDNTPIYIDIYAISREIGITPEEYNTFLNEYIDTAIHLEKDLQSTDSEKRETAIKTLSHLSNVLHLPKINEIMETISSSDTLSQASHITSLYATLSRLTTQMENGKSKSEASPLETELVLIEPEEHHKEASTKGFGTIDLSEVTPVHFDFQLEEAANDLSLPVELIEEFVNDFIAQAKVETPKMLEAYEKGDLETIQKIGHLLKGAASNLRITPLADTLYEIQFCKNSDQLEPLIKNYWAHFLAFENQMNLISK
jgi:hypothetical protein